MSEVLSTFQNIQRFCGHVSSLQSSNVHHTFLCSGHNNHQIKASQHSSLHCNAPQCCFACGRLPQWEPWRQLWELVPITLRQVLDWPYSVTCAEWSSKNSVFETTECKHPHLPVEQAVPLETTAGSQANYEASGMNLGFLVMTHYYIYMEPNWTLEKLEIQLRIEAELFQPRHTLTNRISSSNLYTVLLSTVDVFDPGRAEVFREGCSNENYGSLCWHWYAGAWWLGQAGGLSI